MKSLDPKKLTTSFNRVTQRNPIIPRKYTLTHSDITAELFLTVGQKIAYEALGPMRDEVLAKWRHYQNGYALSVLVQVDAEKGNQSNSAVRYKIFTQEMPLALEAIRWGDRIFFESHPTLDKAPIWITFASSYPEYDSIQYWGIPSNYMIYS